MLTALKPIADRAESASVGGKLVTIEVWSDGITIVGRLFLPGADPAAPPITMRYSFLCSWPTLAVDGTDALDRAMSDVLDKLERARRAA
jgi:hypothetical protein